MIDISGVLRKVNQTTLLQEVTYLPMGRTTMRTSEHGPPDQALFHHEAWGKSEKAAQRREQRCDLKAERQNDK